MKAFPFSLDGAAMWTTTILAEFESRAICGSTLSVPPNQSVESTIPSTTVPTTATIESSISRKLTISGGPDEAVSDKHSRVPTNHELQQHAVAAKYECHHPRPQEADMIVGQHYESSTVSWVWEPSLPNNFEFEGEYECGITKKWERITTSSVVAKAETN
ncbi:hypothetical protein CR513_03015, partial [Mucuna pruriens]